MQYFQIFHRRRRLGHLKGSTGKECVVEYAQERERGSFVNENCRNCHRNFPIFIVFIQFLSKYQ